MPSKSTTAPLKIKNWSKYQHYTKRNPPWIKLHIEILQSEDWVTLSDASKLLAVVCMMLASRNAGSIPNDPHYIKRVAYLDKLPNLKPLIDCGFLENTQADASVLQADARPETETEQSHKDTGAFNNDFDSWWRDFPKHRKGARGPTQKKYLSLVKTKKATEEELRVGLDRYNAAGYGQSVFAKGALAWLNAEFWTIENFAPPGDGPRAVPKRSGIILDPDAPRTP